MTEQDVPLLMIGIRRLRGEVGNVGMDFSLDFTTCPRREVEAALSLLGDFLASNLRLLAETPEQGPTTPDGAVLPLAPRPPAVHANGKHIPEGYG